MKLIITNLFICLIGIFFSTKSIGQSTIKNDSLFTYQLNYIGEAISNFSGGIKSGSTYLGMINLSVGFDTEKAGFWKGGEILFNGANTHGGEPTANYIGDFQTVSNIEAGDLTYIHEFWYKQTFNKFSITVGLQDLNAEFAASNFGGMFINSSFGIHSTIADNAPSPIFPLTRPGAELEFQFMNSGKVKLAVFDGLRPDYENNDYNTNWDLNTEDGLLYISELEFNSKINDKPGTYKFGFYSHTHQNYQEEMVEKEESNYGVYLVVDQMILKNRNRDGGLGIFSQFSISDQDINNHYAYLGLGLHYCGFSRERCEDEIGVAFGHCWFKSSETGNETAIELSYKATLGEHFFIQPDLQYVINPAGAENDLDNAFVGILRFGLNF